MAVEKNKQNPSEQSKVVSIGSPSRRGDFILTNSPFLYWEGEEINVSQLIRNVQIGLRNRYGTKSAAVGLVHAVKEIFTQPEKSQK